jgi:hypothetical protein
MRFCRTGGSSAIAPPANRHAFVPSIYRPYSRRLAIEPFGLRDNLMLVGGVIASGLHRYRGHATC